nr:peptidase dimerization domain-containing protein [bacterium]
IWIVDNGMESYEVPQLSLGVRGITALEVTYVNAEFDLHSGSYGGVVYNPIQALCEVVGSVYDTSGKITIDGFYDGITPLSNEDKKDLYLGTSAETYKEETTATCLRKEEGYALQESVSMRPTFEVNGIFGGYQGEGSKTIIPSSATAKVTCRLIAGQDPEEVAEKVSTYFKKKAPEGMKVLVEVEGGGKSTWGLPSDASAKKFAKVLEEVVGKEVKFSYTGGSVPLTAHLKEAAGGDALFLGTGLPEDRIHSPNENFGKKQFFDGFLMVAKGLEVFAQNKNE